MPITDSAGNKVTPKNKAKMILQNYFNEFDLSNYSDGMKPGQLKNVETQIEKIKERINKVLTIK